MLKSDYWVFVFDQERQRNSIKQNLFWKYFSSDDPKSTQFYSQLLKFISLADVSLKSFQFDN